MAQDGAILGQKAITLPQDSTANRPTPVAGMIRYNTDKNVIEQYNGSAWGTLSTVGKAIAMAMVF